MFENIRGIGNLEVNRVLFESYYPILFTCVNERNELFLCVCCQKNRNGTKWLITQTTPRTIIELLQNGISLRDAFLKYSDVQITVIKKDQDIFVYEHSDDWDCVNSRCLPDPNAFMDAEEGEFTEDIEYFRNLETQNVHDRDDNYKYTFLNEIPAYADGIDMCWKQELLLNPGENGYTLGAFHKLIFKERSRIKPNVGFIINDISAPINTLPTKKFNQKTFSKHCIQVPADEQNNDIVFAAS